MKIMMSALILGVAGLAGSARADAQVERRPAHGPIRVEGHRRPRIEPERRTERVWIAPRYESRCEGTDRCGAPIYRTVCVHEGYWTLRDVCG